jgi:thiosulfate/3-mercaptopyruvate sulfurtransferase
MKMKRLASIKNVLALVAVIGGVFSAAIAFAATPLVTTNWLADRLANDRLVVIDLRNKIDEGSYETFLQGHIPNSVHSDYLKDGWRVGRDDVVGLLPSEAQFEELARKLGVSSDSHVILVPAGVSSSDFGSAARAYWTFKTFGHDKVSILDGGFASWQADQPNRIATGAPKTPAAGDFKARFTQAYYTDVQAISERVSAGKGSVLLDGRNEAQFYGEEKHPKSRIHGRIPGARLFSQANAYDEGTNRIKSQGELSKIYADYANEPLISYCNTGHWAATNWFVISEILGNKDARLYDGSMVEWTANGENPLEQGQSNIDKIKNFLGKITG